jgi:peptidoglycan/LPS O-acetylase OafA/YrhL
MSISLSILILCIMNRRSPGLDVLRCIAVVLVMLRHYSFGAMATQTGWIGVDLFFVLSGFLVSGLLFQEYIKTKKVDGKLFLIRRGFKIYPTFWAVLILNLLYLAYKHQPITLVRVVAELLFVQNFFENIMGISWSLAIEEHFYFLLIWLAIIAVKRQWIQNQKLVFRFCVFIFLGCLSARITINYLKPFNEWSHLFPTYLRIDSLMFGVFISWYYHFKYDRYLNFIKRYKHLIGILILTGLVFPFIFLVESPVMNTIGLSFLYIAFGGILCFTEGNKLFTDKFFRPLAYIGKYSYSIYLIHILVGPAVANFFRVHVFTSPGLEWVNKSIYLLSNVACGALISLVIEQPFLKLREKYFAKSVSKPPLHSKENLYAEAGIAV